MGSHLTKIVNVTIYYPDGIPSFFDFISGKVHNIQVDIETSEITPELIGDYFNDQEFQVNFQQKVNQIWQDKDNQLAQMDKQKA